MAAGAVPAHEKKRDTKTETAESLHTQPTTLNQRIERLLWEIFKGREEF